MSRIERRSISAVAIVAAAFALVVAVITVPILAMGGGPVTSSAALPPKADHADLAKASASSTDAAATPAPSAAPDASFTLGAGWHRQGATSERRDVDEVMTLMIPLGCEMRTKLPRPTRVLGDAFVHAQPTVPAVLLRLSFRTPAAAQRFLDTRLADLLACARQPDDPYSGAATPVTSAETSLRGLTISERTDPYEPAKTATWTELFAAGGRDVLGLAINVDRSGGRSVDLTSLQAHVVRMAGTVPNAR